MLLYLAGAMRGFPEHNYPLFMNSAKQLRAAGYEIINPAEINHQGIPRVQCMSNDLNAVLGCDGVLVLPGWETSPGACNEVAMAWVANLPVYRVDINPGGIEIFPLEEAAVTIVREQQYYQKVPLIGICGFAQSGKDSTAGHLVTEYGYARVAFADALREMLFALNPVVGFIPQLDSELDDIPLRVQDDVLDLGWDRAKLQSQEIRELLQRLGTEAGREILGNDLWVHVAEQKIESFVPRPVAISDCRFPNELHMVRRRGGTLVWVYRPGVGPVNGHASEHSVNPDDCDVVIKNSGSLEDLYGEIDLLVSNLDWDPAVKPVSSEGWRERYADSSL